MTRYQSMPPLSPEDYRLLETSILADGIVSPIIVDEDGEIIDGHHRHEIAAKHGLFEPVELREGLSESEKVALSITLNVARRHLTREERRQIIEASVKAQPEKPDYQHAKTLGVSDKTVTSVRRELEADSEIPNDLPRVNARGQERPASYEPRDTPRPAPAPRRRPLTDSAKDVGYELRKATDRLLRLREDDRFSQNKEEVAALLRGHLMFTVESCQGLLDELNQSGKD